MLICSKHTKNSAPYTDQVSKIERSVYDRDARNLGNIPDCNLNTK